MTASLLHPPPQLHPWPRQWPDQRHLLERQHERLERQLSTLLRLHQAETPAWSPEQARACDHATRRLLWILKLHLRLEERWLERWGCLCQGHRQAHRDASGAALEGWLRCNGERDRSLLWLESLKTWFIAHRDGADARAYRLAHAASQP